MRSSIYCTSLSVRSTSSRGGTTRELWRVIQELSPYLEFGCCKPPKREFNSGFLRERLKLMRRSCRSLHALCTSRYLNVPELWSFLKHDCWLKKIVLQYRCQFCSHLLGMSEHTCVSESAILKTQACWKASAITISLFHFYKPSLKAYWKKTTI